MSWTEAYIIPRRILAFRHRARIFPCYFCTLRHASGAKYRKIQALHAVGLLHVEIQVKWARVHFRGYLKGHLQQNGALNSDIPCLGWLCNSII